jgi:hypothetical protein
VLSAISAKTEEEEKVIGNFLDYGLLKIIARHTLVF